MILEILIIIIYLLVNIATISYQNFVDKFIGNYILYIEENKKTVQFGIQIQKAFKSNKNNNKELDFLSKTLENYNETNKNDKKFVTQLLSYNYLTYLGTFLLSFLILFTIYCFWFQGFEKTVLLIIIYLIFSYILEQIFIYQHKKYFIKLDTIHFNILLKIYRYRFKNKTEFLQLDKTLIEAFSKYYQKILK